MNEIISFESEEKEDIINSIKSNILPHINQPMDALDILKIFCDKYISTHHKKPNDKIKSKVYTHTNRVIKIAIELLQNKILNEQIEFSPSDIEDLYIGLSLHDIGTIHCKDNHEIHGVIIVDFLLNNNLIKFRNLTDLNKRKNNIIEIIGFHNSKKLYRDLINSLTKLARDADALDEQQGVSLVKLALLYRKTTPKKPKKRYNDNDANLNLLYDYSESDYIMMTRTKKSYTDKIKKKLNDESSKQFYENKLTEAKELYNKITNCTRIDYCISFSEFINSIQGREYYKNQEEVLNEKEPINIDELDNVTYLIFKSFNEK